MGPWLVLQVKELVSQGEYQLRLKDLALAEKEKELAEHAAAEHAAAKARFDTLQQVPLDRKPSCNSAVHCILVRVSDSMQWKRTSVRKSNPSPSTVNWRNCPSRIADEM